MDSKNIVVLWEAVVAGWLEHCQECGQPILPGDTVFRKKVGIDGGPIIFINTFKHVCCVGRIDEPE